MAWRAWSPAMLVATALAACQPLPHPFADDRPPAALLKLRGMAAVWVAPVEGEPAALAAKLGEAMAKALVKRDIPASAETTSLGSYQLFGRLVESPPPAGKSKARLRAYWRLYDARGHPLGEHRAEVAADGSAADKSDAAAQPIERLAEQSAEALTPLLEDEAPKAAKVEPSKPGRTRVAIGAISGAPGDGSKSLAAAMAAVLKRLELSVVEPGEKADLTIDGEVSLSPAKGNQQHVKILWHVRQAGGAEIGTAGQENDVPKGLLEGPWGELAYNVAIAAADGLMQLVERGASAPVGGEPRG